MVDDSTQVGQLAAVLGVTTSAAFAATSLTVSYLTSSALLLPTVSRGTPSSSSEKLADSSWHLARQWASFEALAHKVSMSALVVGTSSFIYAAVECPASARQKERLLCVSALLNVLTIPFTVVFMLRKNNELESRSHTGRRTDFADIETTALMQDVSSLGKYRGSLPLLGAVVGALALVI